MPLLIEEPSKKMGREEVSFCFKVWFHVFVFKNLGSPDTSLSSIHRPSARSLASKALIAAARPLAGTLSAGSLAAKALIAAARA